ncbi:YraN family protein [uncultured Tateyamaria sp.]|uniref:YraN family protein n=1 Tax=uncultured Tateyamaria sp. TaxID=455651 RepID=UPI00261720F5|nr:YraN family protein [uncultured Tateyamaria sp.]
MTDPFCSGSTTGNTAMQTRVDRGRMSYLAGMAAENSVAAHYVAAGYVLQAERWRGRRGEIDLIFAGRDGVIFVEVKKSKTVESALAHVTPAQVRRLFATGEEYVATLETGSLTDVRFDVALVDAKGAVHVMENPFAHGFH